MMNQQNSTGLAKNIRFWRGFSE